MPLSGGRTLATIRLVLGEDWLRWDDPNADVVALLASTLMSTTRRGRAEEQLHERARRDPMTGLLNRDELYRALSDLLDRNATDGLGVLYGDLDHFKDVNDRFGHAEGDRLVMGVAAALVANVRDGDLVARFGGDEFVVVCPDLDSAASARHDRRAGQPTRYVDSPLRASDSGSASAPRWPGRGSTPTS